jgi:excisionase family DNA binding protein
VDVAKLLDVEQVAGLLGLHPGTVYRRARARKIPCVRIGARVIRFDPRAIEKFITQNSVEVRSA